jgi:hypothetical protein
MAKFERMQIWIADPKIEDLAADQSDRMQRQFATRSIPLHVIVDPTTGKELARFEYKGPASTPEDYLAFLRAGEAKASQR